MRKSTASNIIYLFLAILFLTVGVYFQKKELSLGLLITEYVLVLFPAILFSIIYKKENIKAFLRLNKVSFKNIILSIIITLFTYPIAVFGNAIVLFLLNYFGKYNVPQVPFASTGGEYLWFLLLMGVTPGICEEILFRGFFLRMNEEKGMKKSILYTAFLFALFHFNVYNFMGPFILGIVFGYMTLVTNSIYPSIIGHALNNSIATSIGYFVLNKMGDMGNIEGKLPLNVVFIQIAFWGVLSILSFYIIKNIFRGMKRNTLIIEESKERKTNIFSYVPIGLCVIIYMYIFIRFQ